MIAGLVAAAFVLASPPSHVMDLANVFDEASKTQLEQRLVEFENRHRIEVVVATFDSLGGRPEHAVNLQLAKDWAIGSRTSKRGVLISYWKGDRATRIDMTDALPQFTGGKAAEIVDSDMIPHFKAGRPVKALDAGATGVMTFLDANPWSATPIVTRTLSSRQPSPWSGGFGSRQNRGLFGSAGSVALVVVFLVFRVMMASAGIGGGGYRRGWGARSSSSWGGSSRSSWGGGGSRGGGGGGGGGFSGRGASGRW